MGSSYIRCKPQASIAGHGTRVSPCASRRIGARCRRNGHPSPSQSFIRCNSRAFPTYVLLILLQAPHATRVAGYRRWQALGRQVRKGERGIAIFAPCVYRARPVGDDEAHASPELAKVLCGFRLAHVWDISQTDGDPLPYVSPQPLRGQAPSGLWPAISALIAEAGFTVERGDCDDASGRTHFDTRRVVVRDDVDDAEATCTLVHELAHVLLHDPAATGNCTNHRGTAEVEAESVAYIVCSAAGMAAEDSSLPYVAGWSHGDPAAVRQTAERVVTTARRIITDAGIDTDLSEAEAVPA